MAKNKIDSFCYALFILAIVNFLIFGFSSSRLHGDALNGKVENGKYYVNAAGIYTQVAYQDFLVNKILGVFLLVTWISSMVAVFYLNRDNIRVFGKRVNWKKR